MNSKTIIFGKAFYTLPLILFGMIHFAFAKDMDSMIPNWIPAHSFLIYFTGAAFLATGFSIMFNIFTRWSTFFLGVMMIFMVLFVHAPLLGNHDLTSKQLAIMSIWEDLVVAGGAFYISANQSHFEKSGIS